MKLELSWNGRVVTEGQWVVVRAREICELLVELTLEPDDETDPDTLLPRIRADREVLPFTELEAPRASPGAARAWRLEVRPLPIAGLHERRLEVALRDPDDGPFVAVSIEILPALQARWGRVALYAFALASALLAWPVLDAQPSSSAGLAFKYVFGALPLVVLFDPLTKWVKELANAEGGLGPNELDRYRLFHTKPTLWRHLYVGLALLLVTIVCVRYGVVTFHNRTGHALDVAWTPRVPEEFAAKASRTVLEPSPRSYFEAVVAATPGRRYCLWPLSDCPGAAALDGEPAFSPFRLATQVEVRCLPERWAAVERKDALVELHDARRIGDRVWVDSRPEDCSSKVARAVVDAKAYHALDASSGIEGYRLTLRHTGAVANANAELDKVLEDFVGIRALARTAKREQVVVFQAKSGDGSEIASTEVTVRIPSPESSVVFQSGRFRVPVRKNGYRFALEVGPESAPWGTLTCYTRGHANLLIWLLPLRDSEVRRFQLARSSGEVLSTWTAHSPGLPASGEPSPVVPICLPDEGASSAARGGVPSAYRADVVVVAGGESADTPELVLPEAFARVALRVAADAGERTEHLGELQCDGNGEMEIWRLAAVERADAVDVFEPVSGTLDECRAKAKGTGHSRWRGTGTALACSAVQQHPEASCTPVRISKGAATRSCAYDRKAHSCTQAAQAPPCILDMLGRRLSSCSCTTRPASELSAGAQRDARNDYGCNIPTARLCDC